MQNNMMEHIRRLTEDMPRQNSEPDFATWRSDLQSFMTLCPPRRIVSYILSVAVSQRNYRCTEEILTTGVGVDQVPNLLSRSSALDLVLSDLYDLRDQGLLASAREDTLNLARLLIEWGADPFKVSFDSYGLPMCPASRLERYFGDCGREILILDHQNEMRARERKALPELSPFGPSSFDYIAYSGLTLFSIRTENLSMILARSVPDVSTGFLGLSPADFLLRLDSLGDVTRIGDERPLETSTSGFDLRRFSAVLGNLVSSSLFSSRPFPGIFLRSELPERSQSETHHLGWMSNLEAFRAVSEWRRQEGIQPVLPEREHAWIQVFYKVLEEASMLDEFVFGYFNVANFEPKTFNYKPSL